MAYFKPVTVYFLLFFIFFFSLLRAVPSQPPCTRNSTGPVVSTTPLVSFLQGLQETALKTYGGTGFDPKLYVDLSLKSDLSTTQKAFDEIPRNKNWSVSPRDLDGFLRDYLYGAGEDLVYSEPVDFIAEPEGFLPTVENSEVRDWALEVHSLWKNLSRKVTNRVMEQPELHTLLPLPNPVIIPGSRFREVYYWDSYWVVRGLLASKMYTTAKGIVENLISLVEKYGYVLNGARAYYTNRSQPPFLSAMVHAIYEKTGDIDFVRKALPALLKEHNFWSSDIHSVKIQDAQGRKHLLSRYYAMWDEPRPESSTIDKETASKLLDGPDKKRLYRDIASAAESGWDFSTRWMRNSNDLATLSTTSIVPVDLNAYILKMELDITFFANATGDSSTAEHFIELAEARKQAMNSVLWNEKMGQWLDYWISSNGSSTCTKDCYTWESLNQNTNIFASNFIPLWIPLFNSDEALVEKVLTSLGSSGLLRAFGIATSLTNSTQQWDFPNGWAPIQHLIVEGLVRSGSEEAKALAKDIAVNWVRTNFVAYKKSGSMHEKYDVEKCGEFGGGGEYIPQTGFGWSNGVVLAFLEEFGWPQDLKIECE